MFKLYVDQKFIPITDFSESLNSEGALNFNVSNNVLDIGSSDFKGLGDLSTATKKGNFSICVKDEEEKVVWEGDEFNLQSASFSASQNGVYFVAYFQKFNPQRVDGDMEV